MEKLCFFFSAVVGTWLIAMGLGQKRYRSHPRGGVVVRHHADLAAFVVMGASLMFITYLTAATCYGYFIAAALYLSGNTGNSFYLNDVTACMMVVASSALWAMIACTLYRIGADIGAYHSLQPVNSEPTVSYRKVAATDGRQPKITVSKICYGYPTVLGPDGQPVGADPSLFSTTTTDIENIGQTKPETPLAGIQDPRLERSFPMTWKIGKVGYRRYHKNSAAPEVHLTVTMERTAVDDITVPSAMMTIRTNELQRPRIWASEIASAMLFAGWQKQLRRLQPDDITRQDDYTVLAPVQKSDHPGYTDELLSAAEAKAAPTTARDTVSVTDIVNVIKESGLRLQRDPRITA